MVGGTTLGHLPGVKAGGILRLIGVLLLLVHHDEADVRQRSEHRAAGAHHDVGAAGLYHAPLQQALGVVEGGVLHRHPLTETGLEAAYHLGGEAYLRHQHQGGAPQLQAALDEF